MSSLVRCVLHFGLHLGENSGKETGGIYFFLCTMCHRDDHRLYLVLKTLAPFFFFRSGRPAPQSRYRHLSHTQKNKNKRSFSQRCQLHFDFFSLLKGTETVAFLEIVEINKNRICFFDNILLFNKSPNLFHPFFTVFFFSWHFFFQKKIETGKREVWRRKRSYLLFFFAFLFFLVFLESYVCSFLVGHITPPQGGGFCTYQQP